MQTFTYGTTPKEVIIAACKEQCPDGYHMTIRCQDEWGWIAQAVNKGIDAHLEALTERSTFDNGTCLVHPEELHVLLRRLDEIGMEMEPDLQGDDPCSLRTAILSTLDIEEI